MDATAFIPMKAMAKGGVPLEVDGQKQPLVPAGQDPHAIAIETAPGAKGIKDKRALKAAAIAKSEPMFYWNAVLGSLLGASGLVVMICILVLNKTISTTTYTALPNAGTTAGTWNLLLALTTSVMIVGLAKILARVYVIWKDITWSIHYAYVNGFRWILAFIRENYTVLVLGAMSGIHDWMTFILLMLAQTAQIGFLHTNERDNANFHHAARNNDRYQSTAGYHSIRDRPLDSGDERLLPVPVSHYFALFYAYVQAAGKWTVLGIYWGEMLVKLPKTETYFIILLFSGLLALVVEVITLALFSIRYLRSHEFLPAVLRKKRRFEIVYSVIVSLRDLGVLWAMFSFALLAPTVV